MTPKEKAGELVDKFFNLEDDSTFYYGVETSQVKIHSKKCALIAVDEILKNNLILFEDYLNDEFWKEVKKEIEKYG